MELNKNYIIGINNGILTEMTKDLINPNLVMTALIFEMTSSPFLVSIVASLNFLGAFIPQLYVSSLSEHLDVKRYVYIKMAAFRLAATIILALMIYSSEGKGKVYPLILIGVFFVIRLFRGAEFIVFWDIFGTSVKSENIGSFISYRSFLSSIMSVFTGFLIVQPVITGFNSPLSYTLLAVFGIPLVLIDITQMKFINEIKPELKKEKRGFRQIVSDGFEYLKTNSNYRNLFYLRLLHRINMIALSFIIPFSVTVLGFAGMSGIFLGSVQASKFVSSIFWGRISTKFGNRFVLVLSNIFFAASSVSVIFSSFLPFLIFFSLFFTGIAQQGMAIGYKAFVIESSPPERISSSLSFLNTFTAPMAVFAMMLGKLMETGALSYNGLYILLTLFGIASCIIVFRINEVRR